MRVKSKIADAQQMARSITRLAHEIIEHNKGAANLCLIGIRTRGDFLAKRIAEMISQIEKVTIPLGTLDITLYRDDVRQKLKLPELKRTEVPFDITDKNVILVDDVLFTGRTIRSALDALIDIGRPTTIQLAALVDRGHRELPISADYVGKNQPTAIHESVVVHIVEVDGTDEILLVESDEVGPASGGEEDGTGN
ncbi:MAG: bifunctional pyr operon transcriptional regulator/uracil phosphoribosyltransferase PyrR [Candidatus Kryptoniota bacterium]